MNDGIHHISNPYCPCVQYTTGKFVFVDVPKYLRDAKSCALAACSSVSYVPNSQPKHKTKN